MEDLPKPSDIVKEIINEIREGKRQTLLDIIDETQPIQSSEPKTTPSFSILSYNILADAFSQNHSSDIKNEILDFKYRAPIILEEIKHFSSDIICLQEVDNFDNFYKIWIQELGYEIIYDTKSNGDPDGLILGVKKDKFEIVSHEIINYDEHYSEFYSAAVYKKGNIAISAKLKHKSSGETIRIINSHLFWNPYFEQVKYLQMAYTLKYINCNLEDEKEHVVWAGDFNSLPHSNLLRYMLKAEPPREDSLEADNPNMFLVMAKVHEKLEEIDKMISWASVYEKYGSVVKNPDQRYPAFTNYTAKFKGTLDHILYSKETLVPKKLLKIPSKKEINSRTLPNKYFPSDHLPVMAVFEILPKKVDA